MKDMEIDGTETETTEIEWHVSSDGTFAVVGPGLGKRTFEAHECGAWYVNGKDNRTISGQAADMETAKLCCVRYAKIHKLHMFKEKKKECATKI